MVQAPTTIDIEDIDDFRALVEDIQSSGTARLLVAGDQKLVVMAPASSDEPGDGSTRDEAADDDLTEFMSAAGSWKGLIDPDEFKRNMREGRSSNRPPITFPDE